GRNLILDLVERISHELNISNCWVCGGTKNTEGWPWEGMALSAREIVKIMTTAENLILGPRDHGETWILQNKIIGEECIWRKG
ncbi:ENR1 protein, partial [Orthonyx spaldingii]|nr:ENR1 protein [Orthonyx spaldingii]